MAELRHGLLNACRVRDVAAVGVAAVAHAVISIVVSNERHVGNRTRFACLLIRQLIRVVVAEVDPLQAIGAALTLHERTRVFVTVVGVAVVELRDVGRAALRVVDIEQTLQAVAAFIAVSGQAVVRVRHLCQQITRFQRCQ